MTDEQGLAPPPLLGATALPPGTFTGQVVLVTGGGTGLGKAIAVEFGRLGAIVALLSRDPNHLAAGIEAVEAVGAVAITARADIRDEAAIEVAFDEIVDAVGLPATLVNNAAANFPSPAEDLSPNAWRAVLDITLTGTFLMSRAFGRRHLAAGSRASILNIGASYAWTGGPGYAHSAAAKAGVKNLTETLAVEWAPHGIRVNSLVPGLFPHEDMTADIRDNLDAVRADLGKATTVPVGLDRKQPALRCGQPHELGWAATYLASPFANFISGHTMVVDGANWQRRDLVRADVTSIRNQLGKDPFTGTD